MNSGIFNALFEWPMNRGNKIKSFKERCLPAGMIPFCVILLLLGGCGGGGGSNSAVTAGGGGTGTIGLAWDQVTTNADSTPCTDLAGYRIYYGTASGQYGTPVAVALASLKDPTAPTYDLTGLTAGTTYYIAATAFDSSGNESAKSNEVPGTAH